MATTTISVLQPMRHSSKLLTAVLAASLLTACRGGGSPPILPATQDSNVSQNNVTQSSEAAINASSSTHALIDENGNTVPGAHVMLTRERALATLRFSTAASNNLIYHGGRVETKFKLAVVYWGFKTDPSGEEKRLNAFLQGVGGSAWIGTDDQYYQIVSGIKTFISDPSSNFIGSWIDTAASIPSQPTDAQVQAEATRAKAHFAISGLNVHIIVATAHNHNSAGFGSSWCAYHGSSGTLIYTNLPYMPDAGATCGENAVNSGPAGLLDGVTIVGGHEVAEAQTDPQSGGWFDVSGEENGDKCAWVSLQNTSFSTGSFPTQPLWSNKVSGCVQ
jgi:serine protease